MVSTLEMSESEGQRDERMERERPLERERLLERVELLESEILSQRHLERVRAERIERERTERRGTRERRESGVERDFGLNLGINSGGSSPYSTSDFERSEYYSGISEPGKHPPLLYRTGSDKYPFPQTSHNRTYKSIHGVYGTPLNAAWALEAAYWKKCSVGITVEFCKL